MPPNPRRRAGAPPTPAPADPRRSARPADPGTARPPDTHPGPQSPSAGPSLVPGYEIERELGRGGMGVVYLARHVKLKRTVALKMVLTAGPRELARFLAEAEAVAAIDHPHVVRVYEYGEHAGRPYLAMEYVGGGSLADLLESRRQLAPTKAAGLVAQVAAGVQAAHALGIVHRDLKPANVLLTPAGEPKVTDFGLAKRGAADLTRTNAVMGTPAYMAPEQAAGKTKFAGPAADVYALGVTLFHCLTGRLPFDAGDSHPVLFLKKVVEEEAPPVRALAPKVPRDLELIVEKCLRKDPAARYPTAGELAEDLGLFRAGEPVSVRPPGAAEKAVRWVRRYPTRVAAYGLTLFVLTLVAITSGAVTLWRDARRGQDAAVAAKADVEAARDQLAREKRSVEAARDALAKEREKLAAVEYGRSMQVAYQECRENSVPAALDLLAGTRPDLRGWEYDYVHRLCHPYRLAFRGHTGGVQSAAFSPDGRRVVTAAGDKTARVWDAATGAELLALKGHTNFVHSAVFSPDGRRVVTASVDKSVLVWDSSPVAREFLPPVAKK